MANDSKQMMAPARNIRPGSPATPPRRSEPAPSSKPPVQVAMRRGPMEDEMSKLRSAAAAVHQIRIGAQQELEAARKMRAEARRYQQETETKARSEAQQLILRTRLATQKDIEEMIRKASAEIQKVLADIRMIRITAQEELAAQRKFTDAARINSLSLALRGDSGESKAKTRKQLAVKK